MAKETMQGTILLIPIEMIGQPGFVDGWYIKEVLEITGMEDQMQWHGPFPQDEIEERRLMMLRTYFPDAKFTLRDKKG